MDFLATNTLIFLVGAFVVFVIILLILVPRYILKRFRKKKHRENVIYFVNHNKQTTAHQFTEFLSYETSLQHTHDIIVVVATGGCDQDFIQDCAEIINKIGMTVYAKATLCNENSKSKAGRNLLALKVEIEKILEGTEA